MSPIAEQSVAWEALSASKVWFPPENTIWASADPAAALQVLWSHSLVGINKSPIAKLGISRLPCSFVICAASWCPSRCSFAEEAHNDPWSQLQSISTGTELAPAALICPASHLQEMWFGRRMLSLALLCTLKWSRELVGKNYWFHVIKK